MLTVLEDRSNVSLSGESTALETGLSNFQVCVMLV